MPATAAEPPVSAGSSSTANVGVLPAAPGGTEAEAVAPSKHSLAFGASAWCGAWGGGARAAQETGRLSGDSAIETFRCATF